MFRAILFKIIHVVDGWTMADRQNSIQNQTTSLKLTPGD
jgi:hypothetical protein